MDEIIKNKVVGYVRLSPDDKKEETSIANQKKDIETSCKDTNRELVKIYEDKYITGSDRYRPAFTEMINEGLQNKGFKEIIVKDSSRFARDPAFSSDTLSDLKLYGIKVFSLVDNKYLDPDDFGDNIRALLNKEAIIKGRLEYKRMFERKRKTGEPSTQAPFGYKMQDKLWVIDIEEANIIKQIFELKDKLKTKDICNKFEISKSLYYKILNNKRVYEGYCVIHRINKSDTGKTTKEIIEYKGLHTPIL